MTSESDDEVKMKAGRTLRYQGIVIRSGSEFYASTNDVRELEKKGYATRHVIAEPQLPVVEPVIEPQPARTEPPDEPKEPRRQRYRRTDLKADGE